MDTILVYMTAPDMGVAEGIGRAVVERRLAACVNIIPGMRSLYWWNGGVQSGQEVVLIAKTTTAALPALHECVLGMHPYEVPCIVSVALRDGHGPFLDWIKREVGTAVRIPKKC